MEESNKKTSILKNFRKHFREIFYFYFDTKKREQFAKMGFFKRWFYTNWWFFKSLVLKFTLFRRLLFLGGLVLFFIGFDTESGSTVFLKISFWFLFIIIILELKDKLLAQDELAIGKRVQSALMPEKNPSFPGWDIWLYNNAAKEVSGDLLDYINISENKFGVALGDVSGKGLGAALLMARLQACLIALVPNFESFSELGKQLNRIFCKDCLPNTFASLVYIELNSDSGDLRILNAGHIPPVMLKDGRLEEMPKGQTALGLARISEYKEERTNLSPGDIFIAYSDGLTEARNEKGDFYGEERLNDLFLRLKDHSAEEAGKFIKSEIDNFIGYARQNDDISLVVLKRKN